MAQGVVTDYFATKKKNASSHPSKKRKVEITRSELTPQLDITNTNPYRNLLDSTDTSEKQLTGQENKKENVVFSPLQTRAGRKAKSVKAPVVRNTTRTRKAATDNNQKLISDAFSDAITKDNGPKLEFVASVTSSWDDHDGPPLTPQKCEEKSEVLPKSRKRTRDTKTIEKEKMPLDVTPEKRKPTEKENKTETKARKKLQLKSKIEQSGEESESILERREENLGEKSLPVLPKPKATRGTPKSLPAVKISANVEAALKKCKQLNVEKKADKVTAQEVKAKLSKAGNLDELKQQLSKLKDTRNKIKAKTPSATKEVPSLGKFDNLKVEVPSEAKATVPAYERFHHLATPSAPTLSLPYKYKLLAEQFRGMDTVVSMLHNRNEICTFSKLKAAVQELTKRNFEEKHVGQVETVYPTAYELRQEKGISTIQGFKKPGYQLTVTANLDEAEDGNTRKQNHTTFKASHLLTRRNKFHNGLIHVVKQHHKEFLSKLSRPLTIPDDKITRWHPKFPLDEVPDIESSPLPQPPNTDTFQTAKDVLEKTRGKVMPQVQAALESTAKESQIKTATAAATRPSPAPPAPTGTQKGSNFQSLLERVRAKEAAKTAESLMRNPKEEKRIVMMKRLPNIMRIVRSQFVTEKKPALLLEQVVQKVLDSYKSCIPPGDIEPHLNLCMELVPEWMSVVQIKKGKYVKIDKNLDLQSLTDKIENIAKTSK